MKKLPRKIKHWAADAYKSLEKAMILFSEEYPSPTEDEKLDIISFAVPFAAMNRGINEKEKIHNASEYVLENLSVDMQAKESDEPIYHPICFLIAYLDAHVSFGILSESKAESIMDHLSENYKISTLNQYPPR